MTVPRTVPWVCGNSSIELPRFELHAGLAQGNPHTIFLLPKLGLRRVSSSIYPTRVKFKREMHRFPLNRCGTVAAGKLHGSIQRWSVLARPCAKRFLSKGPDDDSGTPDTVPGTEEAKKTPDDRPGSTAGTNSNQPAGRGQGAFSQFLRLHERKIDQHIDAIEKTSSSRKDEADRYRQGEVVSGQFDDAEEPSQTSEEARSGGRLGPMWPSNEKWQEEWFSHEDKKYDAEEGDEGGLGGDISELDDCEEDDHFDPDEEYDPEVWEGYTEEQFKEFKELGIRLDREEREQLDALQKKWLETKAQAEKEYGTSAHLELPDIIIKHEFTYEAPPGKATADRAMPLPRPMQEIVDSMKIPTDLDVMPNDPEYEQVLNMWTMVSKNNTMTERMKKDLMGRITRFIAKNRNSDALEKALQTPDFAEIDEKKGR